MRLQLGSKVHPEHATVDSSTCRVLLIADPASVWTVRFVEEVLVPQRASVVLTYRDLRSRMAESRFNDRYANAGVEFVFDDPISGLRIPRVWVWARDISLLVRMRRRGPFDVLHAHYINKWTARWARTLSRWSKRSFASFWGSDLLRQSDEHLKDLSVALRGIDAITCGSMAMLPRLRERFSGSGEIHLIHFGVSGLDRIDRLRASESRSDWCTRFGVDDRRVVVVLGYNARPAQQHLAALHVLKDLSPDILDSVELVVPLGYSVEDENYVAQVRDLVRESFPHFTLVEEYLDENDQARLALLADVFINAQSTDMFSASMQEFLYAGALMLKGAWLRYVELDEWGIPYSTFEDFDELPEVFVEGISEYKDGLSLRRECSSVLSMHTSWTAVRGRWQALYGGHASICS